LKIISDPQSEKDHLENKINKVNQTLIVVNQFIKSWRVTSERKAEHFRFASDPLDLLWHIRHRFKNKIREKRFFLFISFFSFRHAHEHDLIM
jgi:hypothetical protein